MLKAISCNQAKDPSDVFCLDSWAQLMILRWFKILEKKNKITFTFHLPARLYLYMENFDSEKEKVKVEMHWRAHGRVQSTPFEHFCPQIRWKMISWTSKITQKEDLFYFCGISSCTFGHHRCPPQVHPNPLICHDLSSSKGTQFSGCQAMEFVQTDRLCLRLTSSGRFSEPAWKYSVPEQCEKKIQQENNFFLNTNLRMIDSLL